MRGVVAATVAVALVLVIGWKAGPLLRSLGAPDLSSVSVVPATVDGCKAAEGTVAMEEAAPEGGATVELTATAPVASVPEQVAVEPGATRASFPVHTQPVDAAERVVIHAAYEGSTAEAPLRVQPADAHVLAGDPDPACQAAFHDQRDHQPPTRTGEFDAERVPEASGIAASRRNPGWLYLVDDTRPREIWAVRPDGSGLQPVPIQGFVGRDTEDIAVAPCGAAGPGPCVYVGDIGDNFHRYPDVAIVRFPEPDLSGPVAPVAAETIHVRYPDGPVDAEALLVDDVGVPHIVTKEADEDGAGAARLFAAPGFVDGTLTALGPVPVPEPTVPLASGFLGVVVTGGDYRDGRVLLRTYDSVVEYVAPDPSAPLSELGSWPARAVPAPREPQGEAVGWAADGCGYYTASEQVGDIWFMPCRP